MPLHFSINTRAVYGTCLFLFVLLLGYSLLGTLRQNSALTKTSESKLGRILLVIVMTRPSHSLQRYFIRRTWAIKPPENTILYFTIGTKNITQSVKIMLEFERQQYNDLLLIDNHTDTYQTLTQKMLETYRIVNKFTFDYFLKVDEDSFVNLKSMKWVVDTLPEGSLYKGFFFNRGKIYNWGKHKDLKYHLCETFLPYALGGGYMLSRDLVQYIADNAHRLRKFANEDVSLGTWLAPLDITISHDIRFWTDERRYGGCSNFYLVINPVSTRGLLDGNKTLHTKEQLCFSAT